MAYFRSICSLPAWIATQGKPLLIKLRTNLSASACFSTNTSILLAWFALMCFSTCSRSILSLSSKYLSPDRSKSTMFCLISLATTPTPPTMTSTGSDKICLAKISNFLGKVAENNIVCLSGRTCERIFFI